MKVRITKLPDKKNDARNAAKWHEDGGYIHDALAAGKYDIIRAAINEVKNRKI